jgi:hypothetical protein
MFVHFFIVLGLSASSTSSRPQAAAGDAIVSSSLDRTVGGSDAHRHVIGDWRLGERGTRPGMTQEPQTIPAGLAASDWASIRQAYERHRHQVVPVTGTPNEWHARNPGQQWHTRFTARGFMVQPDSASWTWGLTLQRYGIAGMEREVRSEARVRVDGTRVTYTWDSVVDEWFVNDARGLEHGFTLRQRPAGGTGPVVLWLGVRGNLRPDVQPAGHGVIFRNAQQSSIVTYTGLTVTDVDGHLVPARFESDGRAFRLVVEDDHARYPLTIDPVAQQAYLKASNTGAFDQFGASVAVSGDTVVVGAIGESSNATGADGNQADNSATQAGAAYVFTRSEGVWSQQAYLKASNTGAFDQFGTSVAVSGDTVVVGVPREASNATGVNGNQGNNSADASGAAYVFTRSGGVWSQQAYLKASNTGTGDFFGASVAVSADTVVVGALLEDSNATGVGGNQVDNSSSSAGAAYVFARSGGVWNQQAYLKASNTGTPDFFGRSVAVSGDTVVVGADVEDSNATGVDGNQADNSADASGAAYVFTRSGGVWSQQAYLKASNTGAFDQFGISVSVSGDTVVVGALSESSNATAVDGNQGDNSALGAGAAYVFTRSEGVWSQQAYLKPSNSGAGDRFGVSVAVSGDTVVVGAYGEDSNATGVGGNQVDNSASSAGAAYVFTRSGGVWNQRAYLKASNTGASDQFGESVAVSGDTVVVGVRLEDSNATGADGNQADNSAEASGAAYVFTIGDLDPPLINCEAADGLWHATNVSLACTAEDGGSGLANAGDANFTLTTSVADDNEQANAFTGSRQVCDQAGNCTIAGPIGGNRIDRRDPSIAITAPAATSYLLNQNVASVYTCTDGGSGVATCAGPVASGSPFTTASVGSKLFTVNATDNVANQASLAVSYAVTYAIYLLYDPSIRYQSGSRPLMRLQLLDAAAQNKSVAGLSVTALRISPRGSINTTVKALGDNFVFDATLSYKGAAPGGGYRYSLNLTGVPSASYDLVFSIGGDPILHVAPFEVR